MAAQITTRQPTLEDEAATLEILDFESVEDSGNILGVELAVNHGTCLEFQARGRRGSRFCPSASAGAG